MSTAVEQLEAGSRVELVPAIECEQLRVSAVGFEGRVNKDARLIEGFVVAQLGPFRTAGKGEFDERSLKQIVRLMKLDPDGLLSYYKHASPTEPDRLGWFLGRAKNPRIETIGILRQGEKRKALAVVADLHLDDSAFEGNPNGEIGAYVMKLAASDPRSFAASLVLHAAKEHRLFRGRPVLDEATGEPLPPLFRPLELASIDIVQSGEAVDSFLPTKLSANQDFYSVLDCVFTGSERVSVQHDIEAFIGRYLSHRFGEEEDEPSEASVIGDVRMPSINNVLEATSPLAPVVSDEALRVQMWLAENA